jgi:uncharacterized protein GlcG (DUF336 family)
MNLRHICAAAGIAAFMVGATASAAVLRVKPDKSGSSSVIQAAIDKAVSSAMYRRSTKVFQDAVAGGGAGLRSLNLRGASTVEGGLPLIVDGKIVGGIGVSGVQSSQDAQVAAGGLTALATP